MPSTSIASLDGSRQDKFALLITEIGSSRNMATNKKMMSTLMINNMSHILVLIALNTLAFYIAKMLKN